METLILRAKLILADMFNINLSHFETHVTRQRDVIEARRFLVYFLRDELGLTYKRIAECIPAITNHATAIHHHKKLAGYLEVYEELDFKYQKFRQLIINDPDNMIENEIQAMLEKKKRINNQIYKLKKLI
tara:strand:- start:3580 stop:3969 length:390 start_codon:yes stop_codon:yes gene_type:complete